MSCNNINAGKVLGKDSEPSATNFGIIKTIEFIKNPENAKAFSSDIVHVSNLLRTWITAVLLYGSPATATPTATPTVNNRELKLCISPWIKEHLVYLQERGNYQKSITHTLKKFHLFLTRLKAICDEGGEDFFNSLPNVITILLPGTNQQPYQSVSFIRTPQGYQYDTQSNIVDTVGPNTTIPGFYSNGDLQKFMDWFYSIDNCYVSLYQNPQTVHVVTHSAAMKSYLKTKNVSADDGVLNTNSWRFITTKEGTDIGVIKNSLVAGVLINEGEAKQMEENEKNTLSLCGTNGSVGTDDSFTTRALNMINKFGRMPRNVIGRNVFGRNMGGSGKRRTNKQKKSINKNKNKNKSKKRRFTKNKTK
jgi:hypothetical protein